MSKVRDARKRLQRAAAAGGDAHRAVMRLAPDGDAWTSEALASGVGKPVRDGQDGPTIGDVRRLWRKDGWIMAEVGLSPEHVARITGDSLRGASVSLHDAQHEMTPPTAVRRVRTAAGVQRYGVEQGALIARD